MISFEQKTSTDIIEDIAMRVRARRKEAGLTQAQLAKKAGVSLSSYKRFEQTGLISFRSLAAIGIALGCESDFDTLFSWRIYSSIEEVIALSEKGIR